MFQNDRARYRLRRDLSETEISDSSDKQFKVGSERCSSDWEKNGRKQQENIHLIPMEYNIATPKSLILFPIVRDNK